MIRFERFTKRFGATRAVEELTLSVARGEVVALLGPNGSGKTTSLKATAGLVLPTSGRVLVGEPGQSTASPEARRLLSFLPQKVSFPESLSGGEIVEFYGRLRGVAEGSARAALQATSLNGASARTASTYSGGMTQRLGLAVAALPDVRVFLLDEPTSSLDAEGLDAFYRLVERWRGEGRAVLFSSHQFGDVERLADRIAILVEGRLRLELGGRELSARLAARGVMRLRVEGPPARLLERVATVAPGSRISADELLVPGSPETRAAALEAVRMAGGAVVGLTAEEGRLESIYRDLVEGSP